MEQHENVKLYVIGTHRYASLLYINNLDINSVNKLLVTYNKIRTRKLGVALLIINYNNVVEKLTILGRVLFIE